tara:strand:+ start:7079 stop:7639 length:561 start_codon:yes stop_codon:yes gene_type:complete
MTLVQKKISDKLTMAEEENQEQEKAETPKKKKDWKKILTMAFVAINVLGGGAAVFTVYSNTIGYVADPIGEEIKRLKFAEKMKFFEEKPIIYSMDPFVINLAGKARKSMQIEMSLEMVDENGYEEVITKTTEARDRIAKILNEKSFTDLESIQGKLLLKDEIIGTLNRFLDQGVVKGIYFTNLVVQ